MQRLPHDHPLQILSKTYDRICGGAIENPMYMYKRKFSFGKVYENFSAILNIFLDISFAFFCIYVLFTELINFNNNTLSLTNAGFAILMGFSSVSFSWARNQDDKDKAKRINACGVNALYGAIAFLIGSGFKFVAIETNRYFINNNSIIYFSKILTFICLAIAVIRFYNVISELIRIIFISRNE